MSGVSSRSLIAFFLVVQIAVLDSSSIPPVAIRVLLKFVVVTRSDTTGGTALGRPLERFFCHSGSNGCEYISDEHEAGLCIQFHWSVFKGNSIPTMVPVFLFAADNPGRICEA